MSIFSRLFTPTKFLQFAFVRNSSWIPGAAVPYQPVPKKDGRIFDPRKDRQVIEDGWVSKNKDIQVKFELLDMQDIDYMAQLGAEYFPQINIMQAVNLKPEEAIHMMTALVPKWIKCKNSIIYKNSKTDQIYGFSLASLHTRDEFPEIYVGELFQDNPQYVFKPDYADDIRNGPFDNKKLNQIAVFLNDLEQQTGKFLPSNVKNIGLLEFATTVPEGGRIGAMTRAGELTRKIFAQQGVSHELGYYVAAGSTKMALQWGWNELFKFPYDKYCENGHQIFKHLYDEADACRTLVASVDEQIKRDEIKNNSKKQ